MELGAIDLPPGYGFVAREEVVDLAEYLKSL